MPGGRGFPYLDHVRDDRLGEADVASLDMAPWAAPELTGLHRVPMHSVPHEDRVPLDGEWRFQLLPAADAAATDAWRTITVPGSWAMQDTGDLPQYTNIVMPFPDLPPAVPAANPTGLYVRTLRGPGALGGPPDRAPHRGGRERGHRARERPRGRHRQGFAPRLRVRDRRRARARDEHARGPRRQVVGRELHRGPGRVVARRDHPLGLPVLDRPTYLADIKAIAGLADDLTTGTFDLGVQVAFDRASRSTAGRSRRTSACRASR